LIAFFEKMSKIANLDQRYCVNDAVDRYSTIILLVKDHCVFEEMWMRFYALNKSLIC